MQNFGANKYLQKLVPGARDISFVKKKVQGGISNTFEKGKEIIPSARDISFVKKKI